MSKQIEVLKRIGEHNLVEMIDPDLLNLMERLNLTTFNASSLAKLLIDLEGESCVADNREIRENVIKGLSKTEAVELCELLNVLDTDKPWRSLLNLNFRKGSKNYKLLLDWLDVQNSKLEKNNTENKKKLRTVTPGYPLFPHQIIAVNKSREVLFSSGRLVLHMPTGAGKTRTAMNLISDFFRLSEDRDQLVIWLAHSEELCEQAVEEFEKAWSFLGNKDVDIIRHFGSFTHGSINVSGPSFAVISLQSAYAMSLSADRDRDFFELSRKVGLTVMDEAHKATASTYQHVLELLAPLGPSKLMGLTATPGRSWLDADEDEKLATFFNRKKVSLEIEGFSNPVDFLRQEGYLAEQETIKISYEGTNKILESDLVAGDFTKEQLVAIGKDEARNLRILMSTEAEARNGGRIILFACSVAHAKLLTGLLVLRGFKAACVVGSTTSALREQYISDFRDGSVQILINFGVLTTGFDAPKANVAIIARPTQSLVLYSQMVGRVIRGVKANGTASCRVLTVVDQHYGFKDLSESFDFWDDLWE